MGWYGSSEGGNNNNNTRSRGRGSQAPQRNRGGGNYLPNPRIEKIIEGQFVGEGIKWTPAYDCKVSQEELIKFREEFWSTRTQGSPEIWSVLRNAIDADPQDAEAIIKATGLNAHAGIMTLVFDEHKFPYRIPIACINEPNSYLPSDEQKINEAEKPDEETFEGIKIRSIGQDDVEFDLSNYTLISELKVKYLDEINESDYDHDKWIFLFAGRKINDSLPLYSILNMKSGMVIQWMLVNE